MAEWIFQAWEKIPVDLLNKLILTLGKETRHSYWHPKTSSGFLVINCSGHLYFYH